MSLADFERCTPDEFGQVCRQWERTYVCEPWERTRFLACSMLQPWSRKALKPTDVCRFEWDAHADGAQVYEVESTKERFEELVRRTTGK